MRLLGKNANCAESLGVTSNLLARLLAEAAERLKIENYGPARPGPWFNVLDSFSFLDSLSSPAFPQSDWPASQFLTLSVTLLVGQLLAYKCAYQV